MGRREQKKPTGYSIDSCVLSGAFTTVSGRPLTEESTQYAKAASSTVFTYVRNPHTDSRAEFPDWTMNSTAMQTVVQERRRISNDLSWLNQHYFGDDVPEQLTARQADEIANIGVYLPTYLVLRAKNAVLPRAIPENIGQLYKIAQGIESATKIIREEEGDDAHVTPQIIYHMANRMRPGEYPLLVDESTERVCPAAQRKIEETSGVLFDGNSGNPTESDLGTYISPTEFPALKEFAITTAEFINNSFAYERSVDKLEEAAAARETRNAFGLIVTTDMSQLRQEFASLEQNYQRDRKRQEITYNTALGRDPSRILPFDEVALKYDIVYL